MKKLSSIVLLATLFFMQSCGSTSSGSDETDAVETTENAATADMMELDLGPHGMDLTIMVPNETTGKAMVSQSELGGVDIKVGSSYAVSVLFGMGDLEMLKSDLNDDLVYESVIITEEPNLLIYERSIPESGMEVEYHFYYTIELNGEIFDVQNDKNNTYNKAAIEKMVASAKTLKAKEKM